MSLGGKLSCLLWSGRPSRIRKVRFFKNWKQRYQVSLRFSRSLSETFPPSGARRPLHNCKLDRCDIYYCDRSGFRYKKTSLIQPLHFYRRRLKIPKPILSFILIGSFLIAQLLGLTPLAAEIKEINGIPVVWETTELGQFPVPNSSKITWSSFPNFSEAGEISISEKDVKFIGYDPSRSWQAGTKADRIVKLGDIAVTKAEQFSLQQLHTLTGIDLRGMTLDDFKTLNWQTADSMVNAIPGLEDIPVKEVKFFYDFFDKAIGKDFADFNDLTIGKIIKINPNWGQISFNKILDLSNYNLATSIPGLIFAPVDTLKDWANTAIAQVPGLNLVPFSLLGLGFGGGVLTKADIVWSKIEHGDPSVPNELFVSGTTDKSKTTPLRCDPGKPCAYVELGQPLLGKRWASGETQQVDGGYGFLKTLNGGKQPAGIYLSQVFNQVIISTDETTGIAQTGLYLAACIPQLDTCSPKFIGPIPWLPIKQGQLIVLGGISPEVEIPDRYQHQIDEITAKYSPQQSSTVITKPGDGISVGKMIHPIYPGATVTSGYGWRKRPLSGKPQFHAGIDVGVPFGTPVKAVDGGKVLRIGGKNGVGICPDWGSSWHKRDCGGQLGNYVDIQHDNGLVTRYGHLQQNSIQLKPGMPVSRGQTIGAIGSSGWSTGPHLHIEVHENGKRKNPCQYILHLCSRSKK